MTSFPFNEPISRRKAWISTGPVTSRVEERCVDGAVFRARMLIRMKVDFYVPLKSLCINTVINLFILVYKFVHYLESIQNVCFNDLFRSHHNYQSA
jgi:hypothetical protein